MSDTRPFFVRLMEDPPPAPAPPPHHPGPRQDETKVFWAMRNLPASEATKHFLICGCSGSGKTTALKLFLKSIAFRFLPRGQAPEQLVFFDAKGDGVSLLAGVGLDLEQENVYLLNPIDHRGAVWNLSDAVKTPALARHFAALMVPREPHSNAPFFTDAARLLVYAVILALNHVHHEAWSFRDLLCALGTKQTIKAVTDRHPPAQAIASALVGDAKDIDSVMSTLATKTCAFHEVAALWHTHPRARRFSITEFLKHPGVLILANDPAFQESLWPINAMILKALTHEILREKETRQPRHWFVLDEFQDMQNVECVLELLNRGRSKGASVMLGLQGVESLAKVYGHDGAECFLNQCASKTFLRTGSPSTADWAARFFGQVRCTQTVYTESWGPNGESQSIQYSPHDQPLFTASYFMDLPFPVPGGVYRAVHDVPCLGKTLITTRPFDTVLAWCPAAAPVADVDPREIVAEQLLRPWDAAERDLFCKEPPSADQPAPDPTAELPRRTKV